MSGFSSWRIPTPLSNSIGADVNLNNTANYFDGPTVAQGTVGTWFVSGTVTVNDASGVGVYRAKIWDGTTVIASTGITASGTDQAMTISLSGFITNPAGNLRISVRETNLTTGKILTLAVEINASTITAMRVG